MAETGLEASVSDAGVGALCARTAVIGAFLNVKINAAGIDDKDSAKEIVEKGQQLVDKAIAEEQAILEIVNKKIGI